jgi:hypothetical protein
VGKVFTKHTSVPTIIQGHQRYATNDMLQPLPDGPLCEGFPNFNVIIFFGGGPSPWDDCGVEAGVDDSLGGTTLY